MLQLAVDQFLYAWLGLNPDAPWVGALNFFLYDSIKILLLLFVLISIIGFLRTYLSQQRIRSWLSGKGLIPYLAAAVFGAITPFCSCSSIPIFIGFIAAGAPLGVSFAFLIASPLINEYLVVLMLGFFGPVITSLYVLSGLLLGILPGILIDRFNLRRYLVDDMVADGSDQAEASYSQFSDRLRFGLSESIDIVKKIWLWVLAGVAVGALIHNYVPQESIQGLLGKTGNWSVPLATLLGVPMYGSCAAIIPIAVVLFEKGLPLGTTLAFMMAIVALSLPEAVMLRRLMRLQLILIFFGITTAAIIFTGLLFNYLGPTVAV